MAPAVAWKQQLKMEHLAGTRWRQATDVKSRSMQDRELSGLLWPAGSSASLTRGPDTYRRFGLESLWNFNQGPDTSSLNGSATKKSMCLTLKTFS